MDGDVVIWHIGDGRPGHMKQSRELAEALSELHPCRIHGLLVNPNESMAARLVAARSQAKDLPPPGVIIGCGHKTHLALWWLARAYQSLGVVVMRPSMSLSCFGLCIAPRHDFPNGTSDPRVILTRGAIHRHGPPSERSDKGLILLGGPSKNHGWNHESMLERLTMITASGKWTIGDSRRTPAGFLEKVGERCPSAQLVPHQSTNGDWVSLQLASAREAWVTEDSVSMIHEALGSRTPLGVLPVPRRRPNSRVARGLDLLISEGCPTPFDRWVETRQLVRPAETPDEALRCASVILQRLAASSTSGPSRSPKLRMAQRRFAGHY